MNVRATFKGELDSRVTDVDGDIAKYDPGNRVVLVLFLCLPCSRTLQKIK